MDPQYAHTHIPSAGILVAKGFLDCSNGYLKQTAATSSYATGSGRR